MTSALVNLDAYLAQLPNGITSYPHMSAKASVLRVILSSSPCALEPNMGLPPRLEELVRAPPPASGWVLEVELWAMSLAVYDLAFAGRGGLEAHEALTYATNRALLSGPLYRILFAVVSPERLFTGAAQRFAAFHRGMVMSRLETGKGWGTFRLTTPPHLVPEPGRVALSTGFRAALDLSGARDAQVTARVESPEVLAFEAGWR